MTTKNPAALIVALTLSAAALAGCSAGEAPDAAPKTEAPAAATTAAPEPEVTPEPATDLEWGDEALDVFLESYDRDKFSQFSAGTPHQSITGWTANGDGVLEVEVSDDSQTIGRIRWLALDIRDRARHDVEELRVVEVTRTRDGVTRTAAPGDV